MAKPKSAERESLSTKPSSARRTAGLTKKLLVSDKALQHLVGQGVLGMQQIRAAGCCKPDGGTCCPNAGRSIRDLKARVTWVRKARTR